MSLPVLLPGSCCPMAGLSSSVASAASDSAPGGEPSQPWGRRCRSTLQPPRCAASLGLCPPPSRRRAGSGMVLMVMPGRPLLSLGLLQLILGCCTVALSFGALSLSKSPQIRSSCPFWAGSSVNLFVMLSVVCVLLNLAGFILGCQGAQFVSSVPSCHLIETVEGKICICCEESQANKCPEKDNVLKLFPVQSCNAVHLLLKKVFFALCALNALTTTVCLVAAALRYLQLLTTRRPCTDESQVSAEEAEEQDRVPDPEDFVPPAPPPSYFSTFYSCTPIDQRVVGNEMIPLPHIYGSRFKGIEVFCPMEPPPPYEEVVCHSDSCEERNVQTRDLIVAPAACDVPDMLTASASSSYCNAEALPGPSHATTETEPQNPQRKRSHSDPVIHDLPVRGTVPSCEASTQTERRPPLEAVTLRRAIRAKAARARPRSLVDYKSYMDTKLLVARFLEEPSCSMTPDIRELVESIKTVLKSDEEHMDEAIQSASFLDQVMVPGERVEQPSERVPQTRCSAHLHLESCGDISTFCTLETQKVVTRTRRAANERPHSLIGVVRETVL
uniref:Endosomal transmembrane epsin interactor 1 n=1 Tax=Leptobrachium leishanense TaxID=445787 RepID=A0A8C5Q412_9ANUR